MEILEFPVWLAVVAPQLADVEGLNFDKLAGLTMVARVEFVCLRAELVMVHRIPGREKAAGVAEVIEIVHLALELPVAVAGPTYAELARLKRLSAVVPLLLCVGLVQPETLRDLVLAADVVAIVDGPFVRLHRLLVRAFVLAFVVLPGVVAVLAAGRLEWLHMLPG